MTGWKKLLITLPTGDVKEAARCYSELLGFRLVSQGLHHVTLVHDNLWLSLIEAESGAVSSTSPIHLRFIVEAPQRVQELAECAKRLNLPLLEQVHDQPDGTCGFTCLGPGNHLIEISTEPAQPGSVELSPAAVPRPTTEASAPVTTAPAQPPTATPERPTRADRYWLHAQEYLAKIKEELASLWTPFSQTDIAATLEEMKQKVRRRVVEGAEKVATLAEADQVAEREKKRREAEELLARYKQVVVQQDQQPAPTRSEEEGLKPVRKTLGPAPDERQPPE